MDPRPDIRARREADPRGSFHALLHRIAACNGLTPTEAQLLGVSDTIGEAFGRGLVVLDDATGLLMVADHPLAREIGDGFDEWAARSWRGTLVRAWAPDASGGPERLLRLATLSVRSDEPIEPDRLAAAAGFALGSGRVDLAIELARAVVRAKPVASSLLLLAGALGWEGSAAEAEWIYATIDEGEITAEQRVALRASRAANLFWGAGDADLARTVIGTPETEFEQSLLAAFAAFEGRFEDVRPLDVRDPAISDASVAETRLWDCVANAMTGAFTADIDREERASAAGLRAAARVPSGHQRFTFFYTRISSLLLQGRIIDASEVVRHAFAAVDAEDGLATGLAELLASRVALARGDLADAHDRADRAAQLLALTAPVSWRFLAAIAAARSAAEYGRAADARVHLTTARDLWGPHIGAYEPLLHIAAAWVEFAERRSSNAQEALRTARRLAGTSGARALELDALISSLRMALPVDTEVFRHLAATMAGPLPRMLAGVVGHADPKLAATAARQMGLRLLAAELIAEATSIHEEGRFSVREQLRADGYLEVPTVALRLTSPRLTVREIEVSRLVASGQTNLDIARELHLSVRTVETHIAHILAKYGFRTRHEIAALWTADLSARNSQTDR